MSDALLVINAGSSSLKCSIFLDEDPPKLLLRGQFDGLLTQPHFTARNASGVIANHEWDARGPFGHQEALDFLFSWGRRGLGNHRVVAVGHRVVHGGRRLTEPSLVDASLLAELEGLIPLAPLHQPHNVAAIRAVARLAPAIPQVACFDTAFHRPQPAVAQAFALPRWCAKEGLQRYGFHGLSYEYVAWVMARDHPEAAAGRTIIAHLGNGASMCAMSGGRSVATTMGFTALDGLVMGTRCGAIDPGVLLYLIERHGMTTADLQRLLYEQSGLLGVSGLSSDMRVLLAHGGPSAEEAVDLFVYRVGRELGSLAAALGGLDTLVFTGGIGENAAAVRARICRHASWLGVSLDEAANTRGEPCITSAGSRVAAWVVPTNEELMIALHTRRVLGFALASGCRSKVEARR